MVELKKKEKDQLQKHRKERKRVPEQLERAHLTEQEVRSQFCASVRFFSV